MGFWSSLGTLAGVGLAPFTGGTSLAALGLGAGIGGAAGSLIDSTTGGSSGGPSTASAVGQTAGSIEKQRMDALIAEAKLRQGQDALGLQRTNTGIGVGNLKLAQDRQALAAPGELAGTSARGDVLAHGQDATFSGLNPKIHIPTTTGGLRPSMLSDSSRSLGANMSRQALADSISGKYATQAPLPSIPTATPLPSAGAYDKVLQGAATGGSFLDALKGGGRIQSDNGASTVQGPGIDAVLPPEIDTSNLPQDGSGIDPAILELLRQQADPAQEDV